MNPNLSPFREELRHLHKRHPLFRLWDLQQARLDQLHHHAGMPLSKTFQSAG